ncbi:MAG: hypothetical protein ABIE94_00305 [archaeon]
MRIVNEGDFPRDALLAGIGVGQSPLKDTFGITDPDEIRHRNGLMWWLFENPQACRWIKAADKERRPLPVTQEEFLKYFDRRRTHNPHWTAVHKFIEICDAAGKLPPRLRTMVNTLKASLPLEGDEQRMADFLSDQIVNITVIEGLLEFTIKMDTEWDHRGEGRGKIQGLEDINLVEDTMRVWGHSMYSYALSETALVTYPDWAKKGKWNPVNWIGLGWFVRRKIKKENAARRAAAYKETVITHLDGGLAIEVERGVLQRLKQIAWMKMYPKDKVRFQGATAKVYFSYSKEGLWIHIYGIEPAPSASKTMFTYGMYAGYSESRRVVIASGQADFQKELSSYNDEMERAGIRLMIREHDQGLPENQKMTLRDEWADLVPVGETPPDARQMLFRQSFRIPSPATDRKYRWFALSNLYQGPVLHEVYEATRRHRIWFERQLNLLKMVADLADGQRETALKIGSPLSRPRLATNGEQVVSFDEIYPMHLISTLGGRRPVPIRELPVINGQMIGFTGYHGGGKSVAELSVTDHIYIVQSGLLAFGTGWVSNPKKMIGLVFIERGDGSTFQLLLQKITNVLLESRHYHPSEVMVILDELGTGTQEASGLDVGKDVLAKLQRMGIPTLFSTQITDLATFAEDELGAQCFKFDRHHGITPGIGDGGAKDLMKRMGLARLVAN